MKAPLAETLIATLSYRLWTKVRPRAIFTCCTVALATAGFACNAVARQAPEAAAVAPPHQAAKATHASNAQLADPRIEARVDHILHQMTL